MRVARVGIGKARIDAERSWQLLKAVIRGFSDLLQFFGDRSYLQEVDVCFDKSF
jgi:hypothetical protein